MIGAGLSGLTCARALSERGCRVSVFEKSRGAGGRAATRRGEGRFFDHGAQYFTVRDPRFAERVAEWQTRGVVAPWSGRIVEIKADGSLVEKSETERYVGVPGMSAPARALSEDLAASWSMRVTEIRNAGGGRWQLSTDGDDAGEFDAVVTSAPPAQSATLLRGAAPRLARRCDAATMLPCWAVMVAFEQSLAAEFDGAFIEDGPLAFVARNSSKPGRPSTPECWVLHAKPDWTTEQLEADSDSVAAKLTEVFFAAASVSPVQPHHLAAHRWRYARAAVPGSEGCLLDEQRRLAVCGDWLHGDRIEGAFLSGLAAAEQLHALLATS